MLLAGKGRLCYNWTYGEEQIDNIHEQKDKVADTRVAISVGRINQGVGNDVVGEHLPVILATLFDVDDQDLLDPEAELG